MYHKPCACARQTKRYAALCICIVSVFTAQYFLPHHLLAIPADTDGDGVSNLDESWLANNFLPPKLWLSNGDGCPPARFSNDWCLNNIPNSAHLPGFIVYDVVPLGNTNLYNIEFTHFMDYDCGQVGFGVHLFDNEGFSVLVRRNDDNADVLSVQTFAHDNTESDVTDRYYYHELPHKFYDDGLYISENKHSFYAHHDFCETQLPLDVEECNNGRLLEIRNFYSPSSQYYSFLRPVYDTGANFWCDPADPDPAPENTHDLLYHSNSAGCWSKLMKLVAKQIDGIPVCESQFGQYIDLADARKQQPPWVPPTLAMPIAVGYVDLYERENYECDIPTNDQGAQNNYGYSNLYRRLPLRLVCFPKWAYWQKFYSGLWQQGRLPREHLGLRRSCFRYSPWTSGPSLTFYHNIRSFKLYGPSGTTLVVYQWPFEDESLYGPIEVSRFRAFTIPDGSQSLSVANVADYIDFPIGHVSWGLSPLAYAGRDTIISDCSYFTLSAEDALSNGMDSETLINAFGRPTGTSLANSCTYKWYDNDVYIGDGAVLVNPNLSVGHHVVRLEVSGPACTNHVAPGSSYLRTVSDYVVVTVQRGQLVALPDKLDYGAIAPGGYRDKALSVTNNTDENQPIVINPIVTGNDYVIVEGAGVRQLNQGESTVLRIRYLPGSVGSHAGTVSMGNAYCGTVALSGTCANPYASNSMYFDGRHDKIVASNCADLGIDDAFTVELVVLPRLQSGAKQLNQPYGVVACKEDSVVYAAGWPGGSWSVRVLQDGRVQFWVHQNLIGWYVTTDVAVSSTEYTHIACVFDERGLWPSVTKVYINGVLAAEEYLPFGLYKPSEYAVVIGGYNQWQDSVSSSRMYNGLVDECRIWNIARTEAEIRATMAGELGAAYYGNRGSGLVAYWRMNEFEDVNAGRDGVNDVRDMTTYSRHGDMHGAVGVLSDVVTHAEPAHEEPGRRWMRQNYPNPFNPLTSIEYELPSVMNVMVTVYTIAGKKVRTVVRDVQGAGWHVAQWDGKDNDGRPLPSGVYFYALETREYREVRRMLLIR